MKKINILMCLFIIMLSCTITINAKSEYTNKKEDQLEIITKETYDSLSETGKKDYLTKYSLVLEKEINRQIKQNQKNIIAEIKKKGESEKVDRLQEMFKDYQVVIDINDKNIKDKVEKSLAEPVTLSIGEGINNLTNILGTEITTKSSGRFLDDYKNEVIWYAGRTISVSLYQETWTTQAYFKGDYYPTYDINEFIYSWTGSSSYNDRIDSIECTVTQSDGRTNTTKSKYYDTGWADHYYSGSFSKTGSTLNLPAGCIVGSSGNCGVGIESKASFSNGQYITYDIISTGYGSLNY